MRGRVEVIQLACQMAHGLGDVLLDIPRVVCTFVELSFLFFLVGSRLRPFSDSLGLQLLQLYVIDYRGFMGLIYGVLSPLACRQTDIRHVAVSTFVVLQPLGAFLVTLVIRALVAFSLMLAKCSVQTISDPVAGFRNFQSLFLSLLLLLLEHLVQQVRVSLLWKRPKAFARDGLEHALFDRAQLLPHDGSAACIRLSCKREGTQAS